MKKIRVGLYWSVDWHHMEVTKMFDNGECEITETWIAEDTGNDCKHVETYKIGTDGNEEYVYAVDNEKYANPGNDEYTWWARMYATGALNWEPEEEESTMTKDINKIKDYWMATMTGSEDQDWMEENVWNTEEGMQDLMDWFDAEVELGLTEEEMDKEIAAYREMEQMGGETEEETGEAVENTESKEEDKDMAGKNTVEITQIEVDGIVYTNTRPGYYYKRVDGKQTRIPKAEWEQAFDQYLQEKQDQADAEEAEAKKAILDDEMAKLGYTPISSEWNDFRYSTCDGQSKVMAWDTVYEGMEWVEQQKQDKSDKEAEDAVNGKKKAKKTRRSKDIAYDGNGKTLTSKQVDFIRRIPDTCFYENGLESAMWCDVLADEIGGQFAGKPMTVGAMISTLREKDLIYVQVEKVNGKKSKYFGFTDLGKEIAKELGLN